MELDIKYTQPAWSQPNEARCNALHGILWQHPRRRRGHLKNTHCALPFRPIDASVAPPPPASFIPPLANARFDEHMNVLSMRCERTWHGGIHSCIVLKLGAPDSNSWPQSDENLRTNRPRHCLRQTANNLVHCKKRISTGWHFHRSRARIAKM